MSIKHEISEADLIRYVYGETSEEESLAIELALAASPALLDALEGITSLHDALDAATIAPSDACIGNILAFSRNYEAEHAEAKKH